MRLRFTIRHLIGVPLAVLALLAVVSPAHAAIIASDDFTYPDGSLDQQNGGSGWTTQWVTSTSGGGIEVSGGAARGAAFGNPPKYAARSFLNPESTLQLFVSFDFRTPSVINADDYFALQLYTGVNNNLLTVGKLPGSNALQVGNGGFGATSFDLAPDTLYHLVAAYDIRHIPLGDPDRVSLWINPDASDFYNVVTGASSADVAHDDFVAFHANALFFATNTVESYSLDNLVLSNMAEGVGLNPGIDVPEPASLTLFGLGGLGLLVRRRRASGAHAA